jgi:hypothetical protein
LKQRGFFLGLFQGWIVLQPADRLRRVPDFRQILGDANLSRHILGKPRKLDGVKGGLAPRSRRSRSCVQSCTWKSRPLSFTVISDIYAACNLALDVVVEITLELGLKRSRIVGLALPRV